MQKSDWPKAVFCDSKATLMELRESLNHCRKETKNEA